MARMAQGRHPGPEDAVIADVRWFPVEIDNRTGAIRFADITNKRPKWQRYLDPETGDNAAPHANGLDARSREPAAQRSLSAAAAFKFLAHDRALPRVNFIWNTAYCCSTAIAEALDVPFFSRHVKYSDERFTLQSRQAADKALDPRISEQIDRMVEASLALLPKGALPLPNPLGAVKKAPRQ